MNMNKKSKNNNRRLFMHINAINQLKEYNKNNGEKKL